jgi:outer membrane protein assembly factor BamB
MKRIHLRLRLLSVCCGWLLVVLSTAITSCGGGTESISRLIPAHTERYWAAVSPPAVLSDGGTMIVNGDLLWRYNAQGGLLSETVLANNKPQITYPPNSRIHSNDVGDIYLTLYGNEVRRVDEQGATLWSLDIDLVYEYDQVPMDEGLVVFHRDEGTNLVSMLDRDGNIAWSSDHFPGECTYYEGVDGERIYITNYKELVALSAAEGVLWVQDEWEDRPGLISFFGASSNRITVNIYDKLYCFDADGAMLWELGVPSGYNYFKKGMHIGDDLIYVNICGFSNRNGFLVLDGDGNTLKQHDQFSCRNPKPLDAERFTAIFSEGGKSFIGVYDADSCSLQWKYPLPDGESKGIPHENEIVDYYSWDSSAHLASDGLIYFDANGVLHGWDQNGNLLREIASKSLIDIWVEAYTVF